MANANPELVEDINATASLLFVHQVDYDNVEAEFKRRQAELQAEYEPRLAAIQGDITLSKNALWALVNNNREALIDHGKRSFVTMAASYQLRDVPESTKVVDPKLAMAIARKLGVVKKIAKISVKWVFDSSKFLAWLGKNGEMREHFADCVEYHEKTESLTIKPNAPHVVVYSGQRISPPSIKVH